MYITELSLKSIFQSFKKKIEVTSGDADTDIAQNVPITPIQTQRTNTNPSENDTEISPKFWNFFRMTVKKMIIIPSEFFKISVKL